MVFADFSHKGIREELNKLRTVTNTIIETEQVGLQNKKDMTDFIMLDYIYQYAIEHPDIKNYIIFTGDGHFQAVVKYLVQKLKLNVEIYGTKDAISARLKEAASKTTELPVNDEIIKGVYPLIVKNLAYVSGRSNIIPTFRGTVSAVARHNDVPENLVESALGEMIEKGLVYKTEQRVDFNKKVKIVAANWEELTKAGYWSFT